MPWITEKNHLNSSLHFSSLASFFQLPFAHSSQLHTLLCFFFSSLANSLPIGKAQQWQNDLLRTLQIPSLSNSCIMTLFQAPTFIGNPQIFYISRLKNAQKEKITIPDTFERKQTIVSNIASKKKKKRDTGQCKWSITIWQKKVNQGESF